MGITDRKERERQHRRETILAAARELFFSKGYSTTMEEIAQRCELSKGTIYLYYHSKDELYISVILEGFRLLEERIKRALRNAKSVEGKVKAIYYAFIDHCFDNREYFRVTQYFLTEDARKNTSAELVATINRSTAELLQYGSGVIKEGIEQGRFRKDIDPDAMAVMVWRMATGLLDLAMVEEGAETRKGTYGELFKAAIEVFLEGIRNKPARRP